VFEASYRCVVGEENVRITVDHLVMATWEHESGLGVLYEGTSRYSNHHGIDVTVDKREFYVEADELAVYKHTVKWCDEDAMKDLLGHDCPPNSPRKLKLLQRVPIGLP
jgi:hypothetical protein